MAHRVRVQRRIPQLPLLILEIAAKLQQTEFHTIMVDECADNGNHEHDIHILAINLLQNIY